MVMKFTNFKWLVSVIMSNVTKVRHDKKKYKKMSVTLILDFQ